MTGNRTPNRLIHATSPYLLQHAYNPVDWYEWGSAALDKAKSEDKPILVSIGYSSCHWCHVMERESFEQDTIARIMNEYFVCIKVDREERPDIDQIYMESVQAMGVNGGWPLNVFLTPSQKPFYGGTYFPPQNWSRLLQQIQRVFREKRKEIDETSDELRERLNISDLKRFANLTDEGKLNASDLDSMYEKLRSQFDQKWGGMDKAPKFVMPTVWMFLLRYFHTSGNRDALSMVSHTLTRMTEGGLYDQLGGGFSRYSVDAEWFAPHFEKMLYDNAQLLSLYSEAFAATRNPLFKYIVVETAEWLEREMTSPDGGFYSALDADSEGVEGKFYTWTFDEIASAVGNVDELITYYGITRDGNWEHGRNILKRTGPPPPRLTELKRNLMIARGRRIRPALDDKILTAWNAMTIQGLIDAFRATGDENMLAKGKRNMAFMETNLISDGRVFRSFKDKRSATEGFLDDYAFLIQAYVALYESTFDEKYIQQATRWCQYTLKHFFDPAEAFFYFSGAGAEALIARKKEVFDNVIPSSNSVMARNLLRLGTILGRREWTERALQMTTSLTDVIKGEPNYASNWGIAYAELAVGLAEVVITGPETSCRAQEISSEFSPFKVLIGTETTSDLPLFEGRISSDGQTRIYVCFNGACQLPVTTAREAITMINKGK